MDPPVDLVARSLDADTRETFEERVRANARFLREAIENDDLDNEDPAIGLEIECYTVHETGKLATLPVGTFEDTPVNRELGLHNIEVNTAPTVLSESGVQQQAESVTDLLAKARRGVGDDRRLVLDAMWTIPPAAGSCEYLTSAEEADGLRFAENMYPSPRYYALDNDILRDVGGDIPIDLPGVTKSVPSILIESLTTSMQPHLQVPTVESFPAYHNVGLRTLAPVLALATNSPFLPADLYDDPNPDRLLAETYHELRVPVFEQSINAGHEPGKVRFPRDIEKPTDVVDRVVADRTVAPFLQEWIDTDADEREVPYSDAFWEYDHKHGTYWRWLRAVIGGDAIDEENDERSLRIEYRPLPTQPTGEDVVGMTLLVAGLLRGLVEGEHPLSTLDWQRARDGFYNVVSHGLDAEMHWVTEDGDRTTDRSVIYDELFEYARRGLRESDVAETTIDRYLDPIEARWDERKTPSRWKIERVRDALDDGRSLEDAITAMQRSSIELSSARKPFVEWD